LDGWQLLRSEECSVIQEGMPPHTAEVAHFHSRSRQFFYVLSGKLSISVEGAVQVLSPEDGLEVAPKIMHRAFNDTDSDVRFIVVSTPSPHGDRVIATNK
jgi:quercetin dioxygenase-like cupin family protein